MTLRRREDEATRAAEHLAARLLEPASVELDGTTWAATDLATTELLNSEYAGELEALEPPEPLEREAPWPGMPEDADPATAIGGADGDHGSMEPAVGHSETAGVAQSRPDGFSPDARRSSDALGRRGRGLEAAAQRWSARMGALEEVRADADSAKRLMGELKRLRGEQQELSGALTTLTERRGKLPESIAGVEIRLREATDAAAGLPVLEAERERLKSAAKAALELELRRGELVRATTAFESARVKHLDAREHTLALREQRLAGMAAELAGALVDSEPCAVCGSAEHPAPARRTTQAVSKQAEETALAAERAAEAARDRAGQQVTELERTIEVLVERGGDADKAELATELAEAETRWAAARDRAKQADGLTAELERLRAEDARLQDELRDCESRSSATLERVVATDRRLAELTERLTTAAGADGTVERRRARLDALVSGATAVREARTEAALAREQVASLAVRVEKLSYDAGLVEMAPPVMGETGPDYTVLSEYARAVDTASRTAQRQADIEAELIAADRARAHAEAVLAEPEIQAVAAVAPGDLEALETAVAQAQSDLERAVSAHTVAIRRVEQLEELCSQLWAAVDRLAPIQRAHDELARLAEVVAGRGENNRRMSLRSYVLAARLEEVAVAGSVRLRRMSGGRYEFVHTDAAGPRGRRGGLGLDIRDDYTGAIRPAKTLSGGETFMASLALALGLADVVAAESGGLVLDTLFIDEGFGSLDADTLDAVMGVLDELRSGGRVVGVVSHVDEMRQRIPSRLHVIRTPTGSHLETSLSA
ncbi:SbcC/MukB-like Walker B domain-containing protein [Nocardia acidivorans]|uniref:SbcC/MukB-like Walker B domain-containing protein n=1 Tax=Nocardia acidivorans TaxID=404580 RepID=UPI004039A188